MAKKTTTPPVTSKVPGPDRFLTFCKLMTLLKPLRKRDQRKLIAAVDCYLDLNCPFTNSR